MDRKEFLKSACGLGVCGCALSLLGTPAPVQAAEPPAEDQRLVFVRYQLAKLVGFMAADAPAETCAGILEKTGRECAKLGQLGARFKGDPEGYFAAAKKNWGTDFTWDKEKGVVTVAVAEGRLRLPAGRREADAGGLVQLLRRVPEGELRGHLRQAGPGAPQGVEAQRRQALRLRGHALVVREPCEDVITRK